MNFPNNLTSSKSYQLLYFMGIITRFNMLFKSTLFTIFLTTFPSSILGQQCNQKGQCQNGQLSQLVTAKDGLDCLRKCQSSEDCKWFTFNSKYDEFNCELLRNCESVENTDGICKTYDSCCSGQSSCPSGWCELQGMCVVSIKRLVPKQTADATCKQMTVNKLLIDNQLT